MMTKIYGGNSIGFNYSFMSQWTCEDQSEKLINKRGQVDLFICLTLEFMCRLLCGLRKG